MRMFSWIRRSANLIVKAQLSEKRPTAHQRVELRGKGEIAFGENVQIGWEQSPAFKTTYGYPEARFSQSRIQIGAGCIFSNDVAVISEDERGISIGKRCVFGIGFRCYDSDFHGLKANARHDRQAVKTAPVAIGDDCFFGERCMALKGANIGDWCVVGAGSIVTKSFPSDSVIGGNPARLTRSMEKAKADGDT